MQHNIAGLTNQCSKCGSFAHEATAHCLVSSETPQDAIRHFLHAVDRGYLGQMPAGFESSAFVRALRAQIEQK